MDNCLGLQIILSSSFMHHYETRISVNFRLSAHNLCELQDSQPWGVLTRKQTEKEQAEAGTG